MKNRLGNDEKIVIGGLGVVGYFVIKLFMRVGILGKRKGGKNEKRKRGIHRVQTGRERHGQLLQISGKVKAA